MVAHTAFKSGRLALNLIIKKITGNPSAKRVGYFFAFLSIAKIAIITNPRVSINDNAS
jgi:hypothetical protein